MLRKIVAGRKQVSGPVEVRAVTEREMVLAFKAGQAQAYAQIYEKYLPVVQHICQRLLKNPADAEEASQETMLRVLQGLPRFNGRYLLQAWVARIATNVSLDILRSRARRPEAVEPLAEAGELVRTAHAPVPGDPSLEVERRLESAEIRTILAELPKHHRDALIMRAMSGLSHDEMAERMEITPAQAKALIHRAKSTFRRAWDTSAKERFGAWMLVPSFLWKIPMPRFVRRLLFGVDAAGGAGGSTVSSAVATAPATSERIAAAVTAVIVGTAGVGAVAVAHLGHVAPRKPAPVVIVERTSNPPVRVITPPVRHQKPRPHPAKKKTKPVVPSPPTVVVPAPEPTGTPGPSPSPSPLPPSPSPSPSPTLPPEPTGFTSSFSTTTSTTDTCTCAGSPSSTATVVGDAKGITSFQFQVSGGAATNDKGAPSWPVQIQLSMGQSQVATGGFTLSTSRGPYIYNMTVPVSSITQTSWGGWAFVFDGTYSFYSGPATGYEQVPHYGKVHANVVISWREKRIVEATFQLAENSS